MTASPTPAERAALKVAQAAAMTPDASYDLVSAIVFALGSAQLLQPPETAAELEQLRKDRDAFRVQRNGVFKTNERLIGALQEEQDVRLRAENDVRTLTRERDGLRARVAELEAAQQRATAHGEKLAACLVGRTQELMAAERRASELEERPLAWAEQLDAKSLDNFLIVLATATEYEPMDGAIAQIHELIRSFREAVEPTQSPELVAAELDEAAPSQVLPLAVDVPVPVVLTEDDGPAVVTTAALAAAEKLRRTLALSGGERS
ncbi:hypothetical protein HUF15_00795 [Streptomyces samsunensis]|uniref:hypothetical protein n=1 Tax=Streptomyces malaysiensis TaxID=92644 RepID=UPI0015833618|nr:hypothetical protein [Streptomyces samsunensis]NUH35319.1 hypothetical protein [Streptomyces samsunensis]